MPKNSDIRIESIQLYFIPVETRVPLKFGLEPLTSVTCARVRITVVDRTGKRAVGWGETPLSVQWVWPGDLTYSERHEVLKTFTIDLVSNFADFGYAGHPMEIGYRFQTDVLPGLLAELNQSRDAMHPMPWLAALVCTSPFDIALHDAYGKVNGLPVYETYNAQYMNHDLSWYIEPAVGVDVSFIGKYPADYLRIPRPTRLPVWHLVGGLDLLTEDELTGTEPDDGYPVVLTDWIERNGLNCLKIKLRGNDAEWDYQRTVLVGKIAIDSQVDWLTIDFNCTVHDPAYVTEILDQLKTDAPRIYGMILYVEQPFPYELEQHPIDVHSVSARKPLFMDESAHDWELVKLGRSLGWTGVALKTCKTQTGALLSQAWAKAHGMTLMVQDLTNPMLAQVPHVLLGAYADTIMGVESNAMQFYPEASNPEAVVHPGIYQRHNGELDLSSIQGPGFGYRLDEIQRDLPEPVAHSLPKKY